MLGNGSTRNNFRVQDYFAAHQTKGEQTRKKESVKKGKCPKTEFPIQRPAVKLPLGLPTEVLNRPDLSMCTVHTHCTLPSTHYEHVSLHE